MTKHLHIISFSIPYPADYGGVIDVFYKIKALAEQGVKITLHCFQYDREEAQELEQYCEKVYYYPRKMRGAHLLSFLPFIVSSRKSEKLIENLLVDDSPILYEGLHTCASITDERLKNRTKIVRSHNIEHDYYENLAEVEKKPVKRLYFKSEAKKLKRFEGVAMRKASHVLGISKKDSAYLKNTYGSALHVSAFHAFSKVELPETLDEFAFYHGNLGVGENNQAALFLVNEVFNQLDYPLVIAGNNPTSELVYACSKVENVTLKPNLSSDEIQRLLEKAKVNVLPTFQSTGIKLKLLAALFSGYHCIVNPPMIEGTGLEGLVSTCENAQDFKKEIQNLNDLPPVDLKQREEVLSRFYNQEIVKSILEIL